MAGFPKGKEEGIRAHGKNPLSQHLPRGLKAALETKQWNASAFHSSRNDPWVKLKIALRSCVWVYFIVSVAFIWNYFFVFPVFIVLIKIFHLVPTQVQAITCW